MADGPNLLYRIRGEDVKLRDVNMLEVCKLRTGLLEESELQIEVSKKWNGGNLRIANCV